MVGEREGREEIRKNLIHGSLSSVPRRSLAMLSHGEGGRGRVGSDIDESGEKGGERVCVL